MALPKNKLFWEFCCIMGLLGCESTAPPETARAPYIQNATPWQKAIHQASLYMQEGNSRAASRLINASLQDFSKEPALHLMNGLIYEELSLSGDEGTRDLAMIAYQTTISLDPSNWYAFYRAGLIKLSDGDFLSAQELLSRSALLKPNNPDALYSLAMASYYAQDLGAAVLAIEQALHHNGNNSPLFDRAAALIFAAAGDKKKADFYFQKLKKTCGSDRAEMGNVQERMDRWTQAHQKKIYRTVAQTVASKMPASKTPANQTAGGTTADGTTDTSAQKSEPASTEDNTPPTTANIDRVVVFDCYILKIDETLTTSKGINIFTQNVAASVNQTNGNPYLQLTPQSINYNTTHLNQTANSVATTTVSKQIAWSPIVYNLNIMNVVDTRIEILGRPTLSTFLNAQATFTSGNVYAAGITGSSGGSIVKIPTGIMLTITPTKITNDTVTVDVVIENTIINSYQPLVALAQQITSFLTTKMGTTLQLKFNETGMIGGDCQRLTKYNKDGFPGLEDIPVIKLFSSQETNDFEKKSSLFLITPRRADTAIKAAKQVLSLKDQRALAPSLQEWLSKSKKGQIHDTSLAIILRTLAPADATSLFRRGDVLPVIDRPLTTLRQEVAPLSSFLY